MNASPVFILTDFEDGDTYLAQMKAALLSFAGWNTPVIDLTSRVARGNVWEGAFHLSAALPHLPEGSVTLAVVDPGVGSSRGGTAARWRGRFIVCPDNGLLSLLDGPIEVWELPPPAPGVSSTFHGRDWFAPCAARIAVDPGWTDFLKVQKNHVLLPELSRISSLSKDEAMVLHADRFGNCVLSLRSGSRQAEGILSFSVSGRNEELQYTDCYAAGTGGFLLVPGSQGYMEIALADRSAAEALSIVPGTVIHLHRKG